MIATQKKRLRENRDENKIVRYEKAEKKYEHIFRRIINCVYLFCVYPF